MNIATLPMSSTPSMMDNPVFDPGQFAAMMQIADIMSKAKLVPEHLQNKPADCLLVIEQARRWGMSPFAAAQETYVVKGKLLFGGKLVTAVINSRAPVRSPLRFSYVGEGETCKITVSATLKGEDEPREYSITVGEAKAVAGNSSLWKTDPKQQVAYFAARFWARLHCPETILGVWSEDEIGPAASPMRDITPTACDIARASSPPPADMAIFDPDGEERAVVPGEVEAMVRTWCAESTDEQLAELAENNRAVPLVVMLVEAELGKRAAGSARQEADAGDPWQEADAGDPWQLNGLAPVKVKTIVLISIERQPFHDVREALKGYDGWLRETLSDRDYDEVRGAWMARKERWKRENSTAAG